MAKDEGAPAEAAPAPKKKKLLIIIVALVVLVAVGVGAALMLTGGKKKHDKEDAASEETHKSVVVPFEEKFTVNLRSEDGSNHFMQVPKIELEVFDESVAKKVEESKSKVSDRISSTLRGKTMKEMLEPGSDIKLKEELRNVINETIQVKDKNKGVKEVILPASYIVQ
jgi:flagellar FliL protein